VKISIVIQPARAGIVPHKPISRVDVTGGGPACTDGG